MTNHPFLWPAIFAGLTILVTVWMLRFRRTVQPPQPVGDPMMAFEFATSAADIDRLFRHPQTARPAQAFIAKMRGLNQIDFLYITCYTAFSVAFVWQVHQFAPSAGTQLALIIAFVPGLFDVLENVQLLTLLNSVTDTKADYEPALRRLALFTWIKWTTVSWLVVLLAPYFWSNGWPERGLVVVGAGVAALGILALLNRRRVPIPGTYVKAVLLSSLLLMLYAIYHCVAALPFPFL